MLTPGSDPRSLYQRFVNDNLMDRKSNTDIFNIHSTTLSCIIALGQGIGPQVLSKLKMAKASGEWLLLENCHLYLSFMPKLDRVADEIDDALVNPNFRLWLTTKSCPEFSISLLQKSLRIHLLENYLINE